MYRKHLLVPSLLASALLLNAGHVLAGADLSVGGHIQPGACSLALGNGGTVDLGTILRKDLKEAEENGFAHSINMKIHCEAPTKVAFRVLDNRAETAALANMFGLGASGGKNVGAFSISFKEKIVGDDTELLVPLVDFSDKGSNWETGWGAIKARPHLTSWAKLGQGLPQAFRSIYTWLDFRIEIVPVNLDLSQEIAIDGSATMELVYL